MARLLARGPRRGRPRLLVVVGPHPQRRRRATWCRRATRPRDEMVELCPASRRATRARRSSSSPWSGPLRADGRVELMADMSVAAQRPLNWNVLHRQRQRTWPTAGRSSRPATRPRARRQGRRAHRCPHELRRAAVVRVRLRARRHARVGGVMLAAPRREAGAVPATRRRAAALNELAQRPTTRCAALANWAQQVIYDVVAPENRAVRGPHRRRDRRGAGPRPVGRAVRHRASPTSCTPASAPPPAPETDDDWKARVEVWRDQRAVIGASDAGAHLDLLATFNYATVHARQGRARAQAAAARGGHPPHHRRARPALRAQRPGPAGQEGWHADVVVLDPATVGEPDDVAMRFDLPGGAGRLYAEADGIDHVLVEAVRPSSATASSRPTARARCCAPAATRTHAELA